MEVGVAVVGCGAWGSNHVRVWHQLGCLKMISDPDRERLSIVSPGADVDASTSIDEVLARTDVDAIVVASPAATHSEIAIAAFEAGKDVLVEKPLALSLHDGEKVAEAAAESGRLLMVDHLLAYHPAVARLGALVAEGSIGRIRYVYSNRLNFGRVRTEESALWSFAPHDLALLHELLSAEPIEVACRGGAYLNEDVADVTLMSLTFPEGVMAHVFVSWLHPFKEHRFIVVGDREMVVFDDTAAWSEKLVRYRHEVDWLDGRVPVARRADGVAEPLAEIEPLYAAATHFRDCVATRSEPRTGAQSGLAVLRMLDAAERSLSTGGLPARLQVGVSLGWVHPTATIDPTAEIAADAKVWHYSHVMDGARVGSSSMLGQNVFVGRGVHIGDGVRVQNNVSVYEGVTLEDDVFCGPSAVFTNVINPRADVARKDEIQPTLVRRGATIGANATVVCGNTIGRHALVGAGAVVTRDVPDFAVVVGVPARVTGWVCACGATLHFGADGRAACGRCDRHYRLTSDLVEEESG